MCLSRFASLFRFHCLSRYHSKSLSQILLVLVLVLLVSLYHSQISLFHFAFALSFRYYHLYSHSLLCRSLIYAFAYAQFSFASSN